MIRPGWSFALTGHLVYFSSALVVPFYRFYQSVFYGPDLADSFLQREVVSYIRDNCVVIKESSSPVEPHLALSIKAVQGFLLHCTVILLLPFMAEWPKA